MQGLVVGVLLLASPPQASPRDAPVPTTARPAHRLATEYTVVADVTYAVAGGMDLKLDVYRPRDALDGPRPAVVFFHGGGWVGGTKEAAVLWVMPYLELGMAAVNVEYRVARQAHAPAAVEDARCALRWVMRYAGDHGIDPARIVVSGDSAGGHLALATALLPESLGLDRGCTVPYPAGTNTWVEVPEWTVRPAAVVNWYGITDVAAMLHGKDARGYAIEWLGAQSDAAELARRLSPITHVRPGLPPVLTIHGDADVVVPPAQAARLHDALTRAGVPNRLLSIPGGGHARFTGEQMDRAWVEVRQFLAAHVTRRP